ncbi:MAG TPA: discoidin domain-containing protein [Pyrinomonadaceae bacterium]|jgi:hypothetical protein|nr:discoidin domain-containing protein [Pyrinomonadaceae bacterium]
MLKKTRVFGLTLAILFGLTYSLNLSAQSEEPKPDSDELFAGDVKAVPTYASNGMLINATRPISIDSTNPRYFNYFFSSTVNQTVALVGISGDYLPHVQLTHTGLHQGTLSEAVSRAYCGYNKLVIKIDAAELLFQPETLKFQNCVNLITQAGLNKIRLWVDLNSSPGSGTTSNPFVFEQPYKFSGGKWTLSQTDFEDQFFKRLYEVVEYCRMKGVIVEVTLFGPKLYEVNNVATSPWLANHNAGQLQFTNNKYFAAGENTGVYLFGANEFIDPASSANRTLRNYQVALVKKTVDVLNGKVATGDSRPPLYNFYWELANEPEDEATDQQLANWHHYMAKQLRDYELLTYGYKHLISVNYANLLPIEKAVTDANPKAYIDMIAAHYVKKQIASGDPAPTNTPTPPYGAMELIRQYNLYSATGVPGVKNNKVWGFNETRITGIGDNKNDWATDKSVRAEAWEFMLSGGGFYDHLSNSWGNKIPDSNPPDQFLAEANKARGNLGFLSKVLSCTASGVKLDLTKTKKSSDWFTGAPTYNNGNFWSAMKSDRTFLYYIHHSNHSVHKLGGKYSPIVVANGYHENITFKKQGTCQEHYRAEWINPDSTGSCTANISATEFDLGAPLPAPATKQLTSQPYSFDMLLRVTKMTNNCASTANRENVALASNGATVISSSVLDDSYSDVGVIDGDHRSSSWGKGGGWSDATPGVFPDWVQVNFNNLQTISEVDVYTLGDDLVGLSEPSLSQIFNQNGITDFEVQYRDPDTGEWIAIPDGSVTGNNKVWTQFLFSEIRTDAIRLWISGVATSRAEADSLSRVVEIEAY